MRRLFVSIALAASAMLACSNSKMVQTSKADGFQRGSIRKILVVGIFSATGVRESVEGNFVDLLKAERAEATASHALIPEDQMRRETVVQRVTELGYDGVLLTRVVGGGLDSRAYTPQTPQGVTGSTSPWHQYLTESVAQVDVIGYEVRSEGDYWLETRLYDARTQSLAWSGVSDVRIEGRDPRQIGNAVERIVTQMVRDGIF